MQVTPTGVCLIKTSCWSILRRATVIHLPIMWVIGTRLIRAVSTGHPQQFMTNLKKRGLSITVTAGETLITTITGIKQIQTIFTRAVSPTIRAAAAQYGTAKSASKKIRASPIRAQRRLTAQETA